jgi:hypothetical protein
MPAAKHVKVELSARAKCMTDLFRVMHEVAADRSIFGYIVDVHLGMKPFYDADLHIMFGTVDQAESIGKMHAAIRKFADIVEHAEDGHVIAESLNFTSGYDENRMESTLHDRIVAHLSANTVAI